MTASAKRGSEWWVLLQYRAVVQPNPFFGDILSAWRVSKKHIDYMLTAGMMYPEFRDVPLRWRVPGKEVSHVKGGAEAESSPLSAILQDTAELTMETADNVGQMLWEQNYRSVNYRYDEYVPTPRYTFAIVPREEMNVLDAISLTMSYEYQSCETPDWERTEAHEFAEALIRMLIHAIPGMATAKWSI